MSNLLTNWKTTSAGLLLVLIAAGTLFIPGFAVPGFEGAPGAMLVAGVGLIFGKDSNVAGIAGQLLPPGK